MITNLAIALMLCFVVGRATFFNSPFISNQLCVR